MQLLLVESPAKAATLQAMLGERYRVRATEGHIYDLPDDTLGIDLEETFEAQWKTAKGQRNVLAGLRRDAEGCDTILLATDPDREGEAIAHHLADALARTRVPTQRVAFSEVTAEAVRVAVAKPRPLDTQLVDAQQARRVIDRLIGYSVSPHLQRAVSSPRPLSGGRVQSAALRLVCEREQQIADFVPTPTWHVEATFETADGTPLHAPLVRAHGQALDDDTLDEGASRHLAEHARSGDYAVRAVRHTTERLTPPPPLTTATLLQEAAKLHGLRPSDTLRAAQQLYEGVEVEHDTRVGLLTYPRTDSPRIHKAAVASIRGIIARDFGVDYLPSRAHTHAAKTTAQNAHEAIRPTDFDRSPRSVRKYLTPEQFRVYSIAYNRALASQMIAAELERRAVEITDASNRFLFRAEGVQITARGFLQLTGETPEATPFPPPLTQNDTLRAVAVRQAQRAATAPERYTEASLIGALEAHGIGRPSTYAPTLDTIQARGYAVVKDRRLQPTDLGLRTSAFLTRRFPSLFALDFTARLEATLDAVASGGEAYTPALRAFYHGRLVPALERPPPEVTATSRHKAALPSASAPCERCGRPMIRRDGPHGAFHGCSNFPTCRHSRPILETTGVACPTCGMGQLVVRTSRQGKQFYGCSTFPACRHAQSDIIYTSAAP